MVTLHAEHEARGCASEAKRALEVASLGVLTREELNGVVRMKYKEALRLSRASAVPRR